MEIKYLVIHHTAISRQVNPDQFDSVNQYHREKWDFKSSLGFYGGYHYMMSADGIIKQFRAEDEEAAAVIGHNNDSLHICLSGNFDIEEPTTNQRHNLRLWIQEKMKKYNIPSKNVRGHRFFTVKSCPGVNLTDFELKIMAESEREIIIKKIGILQQLVIAYEAILRILKLKK